MSARYHRTPADLTLVGLADGLPPGGQAKAEWVVDDLAGAQGQHAPQPLIALEAGLSTVDKPELALVGSQHRDVSFGARVEGPQLRSPDLPDVSPRSAALALLRFPDYLELIQKCGVDTTDDLCTAFFDELRAVCARDTSRV